MKRTIVYLSKNLNYELPLFILNKYEYEYKGRYMIKINELTIFRGWSRVIKNKSYLCDSNVGTLTRTYKKSDSGIFKTNNKREAIKIAKKLVYFFDRNALISVVDRKKHGNEITFITKNHICKLFPLKIKQFNFDNDFYLKKLNRQ
jgi:hypothetical protein